MAVEFRNQEDRGYSLQYGGSRSVRKQEKLPPGGIRGTRWADLAADLEEPVVRARPKKEEYGANKLPKVGSLQELNTMKLDVVRKLVKAGALDPLINDITDLKGVRSEVLRVLFQQGRAPDAARFNGQMRGVDLNAPHHDTSGFGGFIRGAMRLLQAWGGKQTKSRPGEGAEGTGNNQMFLCVPNTWFFEFNWNVVDSKLGDKFAGDGSKVIRLDYKSPNNRLNKLFGVDMVHDEMREVGKKGSGVFLGMAAIVDTGNSFWKGVYNFGLWLGGREERVGKSKDPIEFIYFALQGNGAVR
jgi:hypothetical protein